MSAPASSQSFMSPSRSRGYLARSSLGPNCVGLTKIETTTVSACSAASLTKLMWPSCNAPMVGTRPMIWPLDRRSSARVCISNTEVMSCMGRAEGRRTKALTRSLNKGQRRRLFKFFTEEHLMIRINENYLKLKASYLFSDIAKRVNAFTAANPDKPVIRLGIGDVTEPLPQACVDAFHAGVDEMADRATFKGYGPEQGYAFLREAIAKHDFAARGCPISADEIFVSDGSKCDCGNIQEIFATEGLRLAIPDPVYPVYVDTNVMAG